MSDASSRLTAALLGALPAGEHSDGIRSSKWARRFALAAADGVMLSAALFLSYWIRFSLGVTVAPEVEPESGSYLILGAALIPIWIAIFSVQGLYDVDRPLGGPRELSRVFHACGTGSMILVLLHFLDETVVVARGWVVGAWVLSIVLISGMRIVRRLVLRALRERGQMATRTVIVGTNKEAQSLARQLLDRTEAGRLVVGLVETQGATSDNLLDSTPLEGRLPLLGNAENIGEIVRSTGAHEVIAASSALGRDRLLELFETLQPIPEVSLRLSSGVYEVLTTGVEVGEVASIPLITPRRLRLSSSEILLKSLFEYAAAGIGVLVLSPLLALIALLVLLDSPGPVIFRRRVIGVNGRTFDAFKFRTMQADADQRLRESAELSEEIKRSGKLKRDPRITRLGAFLRRFSLDELPQLFNVLRGEMSLVGPRMITAAETLKYGRHRANLLTVKPGITGLWQVSGRSDLDYAERVRLDMHYIRNYSVWLDFYILLVQTPGAVLSGRGAY